MKGECNRKIQPCRRSSLLADKNRRTPNWQTHRFCPTCSCCLLQPWADPLPHPGLTLLHLYNGDSKLCTKGLGEIGEISKSCAKFGVRKGRGVGVAEPGPWQERGSGWGGRSGWPEVSLMRFQQTGLGVSELKRLAPLHPDDQHFKLIIKMLPVRFQPDT